MRTLLWTVGLFLFCLATYGLVIGLDEPGRYTDKAKAALKTAAWMLLGLLALGAIAELLES